MKNAIVKRAEKSSGAYLANRGVVIDEWIEKGNRLFVAGVEHGDTVVICEVVAYESESLQMKTHIGFTPKQRAEMEQVAAKFLAEKDYVDMYVRFDRLDCLVINEDRGFVRYHYNAGAVNLP